MSKLEWDVVGEKQFETGVDKTVLFPQNADGSYASGVAWSGITAINESPSGGEATKLYADNTQYLNLYSTEELGLTVEAYMSPEEFDECDGTKSIVKGVKARQQNRKGFGLAYRTLLGNDTAGTDFGYVIHLVYGCKASPSEKSHSTVNDSPEASALSWTLTTTPVVIEGLKPSSAIEINSTEVDADKLAAFESILYGTDSTEARLPLPNEVATLLGESVAAQASYVRNKTTSEE